MGLLNVDGYYNSLLSFIDKAVEEGFISPSARQIIVSAPTAKELVKKLEVYIMIRYFHVCLSYSVCSKAKSPAFYSLYIHPKDNQHLN